MIRWDAGRSDVLDTCGTGGDGAGSFNISTATAPWLPRGVRSSSMAIARVEPNRQCRLLAELGVKIDGDADFARRCLQEANFAFCLRRCFIRPSSRWRQFAVELGVPTIFNWLGPLANPACATRQLLGVARPEMLDLMAGALPNSAHSTLLSCAAAMVLTKSACPARPAFAKCAATMCKGQWTPADFGLEICDFSELSAPHVAAVRV